MRDFEILCLDIEKELGRALEEKEMDFLRWLYQRHLEELANKNSVKEHNKLI